MTVNQSVLPPDFPATHTAVNPRLSKQLYACLYYSATSCTPDIGHGVGIEGWFGVWDGVGVEGWGLGLGVGVGVGIGIGVWARASGRVKIRRTHLSFETSTEHNLVSSIPTYHAHRSTHAAAGIVMLRLGIRWNQSRVLR